MRYVETLLTQTKVRRSINFREWLTFAPLACGPLAVKRFRSQHDGSRRRAQARPGS